MELSESNIIEFGLKFSHAESYLNTFLIVSYKIFEHFLIISEFGSLLSELHGVKPNECIQFKAHS